MTRVLRIHHAGRDPEHRRRERALIAAGVDLTLVVPSEWPGSKPELTVEAFPIVELPVARAGDVNRHRYRDPGSLAELVTRVRPDVVDIHEEPFSLAARQWLQAAGTIPVVMHTVQNLDKRFPPPFAQYEKQALARVSAMYPCSRQAASVTRGKGFAGRVDVIPLGFDEAIHVPGRQSDMDDAVVLGIVGRLVPEKGIRDAVRVLAAVRQRRNAVLHIIGTGPELLAATELAEQLGVRDALRISPWLNAEELGRLYQSMHVLLVPSRATVAWVERFGRVVPEAQACGVVVAGYASGAIAEVAGPPGLLRPEGNVEGLASGVTDLVCSPEEWSARRHVGLLRAKRSTWTAVAQRQVELYRAAHHGIVPAVPQAGPIAARAAARAEFGTVALSERTVRPLALPVLRSMPRLESQVGRLIDLTSLGRTILWREKN